MTAREKRKILEKMQKTTVKRKNTGATGQKMPMTPAFSYCVKYKCFTENCAKIRKIWKRAAYSMPVTV
jgi:hypothetical protein